jgi:hypothetical protein
MAVRHISRLFLFLSFCSLLSCYLFYSSGPPHLLHTPHLNDNNNLSSLHTLVSRRYSMHGADQQQRRQTHPPLRPRPPPRQQHRLSSTLHLDPAQELAAVSAFLASVPQNALPSTVDPTRSIDPELVLDFDVSAPSAVDEVRTLVDDFWARNPVVLFSKVRESFIFYSPCFFLIPPMLGSFGRIKRDQSYP